MSGIRPATDRPIPTNEKTIRSEQTSETESIQKTDTTGQAPVDAPHVTKEPMPANDTKGQQFESRLGGLARETQLQSQFPIPTAPTLNKLPDERSPLERNIQLDEKIDVTKNLPGGHAINTGLAGLDWGIGTGKTGPNHMGVDMTTGGMKAPTDVIADVLNPGKLGQPNTSAPQGGGDGKSVDGGGVKGNSGSVVQESGGGKGNSGFVKGSGNSVPPAGVQVNSRAPGWNLVGQATAGEYQTIFGPGPKGGGGSTPQTGDGKKQTEGLEAQAKSRPISEETKKQQEEWAKKPPAKMTDPDAAGGAVGAPTAEEVERIVKSRLGQVEHGINPDLGVDGGPTSPEDRKVDPMDLVRDPIGDDETSVGTVTPRQAKLYADIHGPRTLNPNSGIAPPLAGDPKGGPPDPGQGDFS
jgi:hypothetical protein